LHRQNLGLGLVLFCFALLGCEKPVRQVGNFEITDKDVMKRAEFQKFYESQTKSTGGIPLKGPYEGDSLQQLTQGLAVMSTMARLGFDIQPVPLKEHTDRILKEQPIAQTILTQIFDGERERFEKVVILPYLAAEKSLEFVLSLDRYKSRPLDESKVTLAEALAVRDDNAKINDVFEAAENKRNCKREKFKVDKKFAKDFKKGQFLPHLLPHPQGIAMGIVDEVQGKETNIKGLVCRAMDPIAWLNHEAKVVHISDRK
jgi:hypothetical protein